MDDHSVLIGNVSIYIAALIMATLCNRAGHYIFALWFVCMYPLGSGPAYYGPIRWGLL